MTPAPEWLSLACLLGGALAASPAPAQHDWPASLAEAMAPVLHGLVAAGSDQCENLKKLLGVTYEQIQARSTPDTESFLYMNLITTSGSYKYNMSSAARSLSENPSYDKSNRLVILIHGFMESSEGLMVQTIAREYLRRPGYTILALDGGDMIDMLYFRSSTYVRFMGEKLGEVLAELVSNGGTSAANITMVGHSLGAHVAGVAGSRLAQLSGARVARITGLDPAGPCFGGGVRLRSGHADYVDIIHTDGGLLGLKEPIGDQDYYPNGGSLQPGCLLPPCCHSRAWQLYAHSVRHPTAYPARLCADWQQYRAGACARAALSYMGEGSTAGAPGSYFLHAAVSVDGSGGGDAGSGGGDAGSGGGDAGNGGGHAGSGGGDAGNASGGIGAGSSEVIDVS